MNLGLRIFMLVVVQTMALLVMVGMKQYTLFSGTPVVLQTLPIDPRSLFSGDYVRLNYAINQLPLDKLEGDKVYQPGDTVYVVLKPGNEYWEPVSLQYDNPATTAGQVAIKGRVEYIDNLSGLGSGLARPQTLARSITVKYGIENYFVPEGAGRELERPARGETVSIRAVVDQYGHSAIKAVLLNGVERYRERLF